MHFVKFKDLRARVTYVPSVCKRGLPIVIIAVLIDGRILLHDRGSIRGY